MQTVVVPLHLGHSERHHLARWGLREIGVGIELDF